MVDAASGVQAGLRRSQIQELELVGRRRLVLRVLDVYAAHRVALALEEVHEVVADEAARAGYEDLH